MGVFARCFVASALIVMGNILFNGVLNDAVSSVLPISRDVSTIAAIAVFVCLAFIAKYRPHMLKAPVISAVVGVTLVVSTVVAVLAVAHKTVAAAFLAVGVLGAASAWCTVMWLLALSSLPMRQMCLCLALGACVGVGVAYLVQIPQSYYLVTAIDTLASVASLALVYRIALKVFDRLATLGLPADHEISRPSTMLPFGHRLFVGIFSFGAAYGFGLCYGPAGYTVLTDVAVIFAMGAVAVYVAVREDSPHIDTLFLWSFAFVLVGLLAALVDDARIAVGVSITLLVGYNLFDLMVWATLGAIASRNTVDAVPAVAWGTAVGYMGIFVGAQVGKVFVSIEGDRLPAMLALVAALTVLAVYMLRSSNGLRVDETVGAIEAEKPVVEVRYTDVFAQTASQLACDNGLTERETQVMLLLARGNNATHICEELCISRNTVKYHARNIYDKLGVHSQQEVVDLVADRAAALG